MTLQSQSFDVSAYLSEGWARRQRLLNPPNAFKAPSAVPVLKLVDRAPERPLWRAERISFDAHVLSYQWHLASIKANRAQEYIKARCVELGADYAKIIDKRCRHRGITGPRQLIMYELKTKFQLSYPRIGREFGGLNHATVLHAVTRIAKVRGEERPEFVSGTDRLLSDPDLKQEVMADYDRGMSVDGLSEKFAVSVSAIVTVAKLENWRRPNNPLLHNVSFKTASVDLPALQSDIESGVTYREMTLLHRISEKTIRRIKRNHGWKRAGTE